MKHLYKYTSTFFLIVFYLTTSSAALAQNRPLLIVGEEWAPFEFLGEDGKPTGINIEIASIIFDRLGIDYEFNLLTWTRAWKMIEAGEADAVLSTSRKESRKPFLYYPKTDMWKSEYVFFMRKQDKDSTFTGLQDISAHDYTVGIIRGNSYNDDFWKAFPVKDDGGYNQQLDPVRDIKLNILKLARGRIDLMPADKIIGLYNAKQLGVQQDVDYYSAAIFSKGYPLPFVKKSSYPEIADIASLFEQELINMKSNGEYDAIYNKWLYSEDN